MVLILLAALKRGLNSKLQKFQIFTKYRKEVLKIISNSILRFRNSKLSVGPVDGRRNSLVDFDSDVYDAIAERATQFT